MNPKKTGPIKTAVAAAAAFAAIAAGGCGTTTGPNATAGQEPLKPNITVTVGAGGIQM